MQTTHEGRDLFAEAGIKPSTAGRFVPDEESGSHGRFVPDKPEKPVGEPSKAMTRPERGVLNMIADLGLSVWEGAKGTARSIGAAGNTVSGDLKDVERAAADQRAASEAGPQAKRDLLDEIERRKKADTAPGLVSAFKNVGGAMIDNPEGTAQFVAEQAPNSAVSLGAGWAGAKGGALAGSAFGPVGTAVGGIGGFLGGMFLGNWLLETGSKAMDKAEGGFTQAERGEALREGATKGAVITGVDALTLGVGGKVAKGLNKAAIEAGLAPRPVSWPMPGWTWPAARPSRKPWQNPHCARQPRPQAIKRQSRPPASRARPPRQAQALPWRPWARARASTWASWPPPAKPMSMTP